MVTSKIYRLCNQPRTVTTELAAEPSQTPSAILKKLYEHHGLPHPHQNDESHELSAEELVEFEKKDAVQKALASGNWGSAQPSELFLQV